MSSRDALPPGSSFAQQAFATAADAYVNTPESWERAVHAAITDLFRFLAARPTQTTECIVNDCGAGPAALAQRDLTIARFTELLQPGFATTTTPPPAIVAEAIGGGIYELVRGHVLERRLDDLPRAARDAAVLALSPFIGAKGAIDVTDSTKRAIRALTRDTQPDGGIGADTLGSV